MSSELELDGKLLVKRMVSKIGGTSKMSKYLTKTTERQLITCSKVALEKAIVYILPVSNQKELNDGSVYKKRNLATPLVKWKIGKHTGRTRDELAYALRSRRGDSQYVTASFTSGGNMNVKYSIPESVYMKIAPQPDGTVAYFKKGKKGHKTSGVIDALERWFSDKKIVWKSKAGTTKASKAKKSGYARKSYGDPSPRVKAIITYASWTRHTKSKTDRISKKVSSYNSKVRQFNKNNPNRKQKSTTTYSDFITGMTGRGKKPLAKLSIFRISRSEKAKEVYNKTLEREINKFKRSIGSEILQNMFK